MSKGIVFFDIETTGVDINADEIIQIALVKTDYQLTIIDEMVLMINPSIQISPEASLVHGYTNEDLKDKFLFKDHAETIFQFIDGYDISGFNIMRFDCPILNRQLLESGFKWNYRSCRFYDAYKIFSHYEKRTLAAALKRYCNEEIEDAHDAMVDTIATVKVLKAQFIEYAMTLEEASIITTGNGILDLAGIFSYNDDKEVIFTIGKHQGKLVKHNLDYVNWMLSSTFSLDTKAVCRALIQKFK